MKTLLTTLCVTILTSVGLSQSPGGVSSGLMVWLKPDAAGITPVADGSAIASWNDASGMGNHAGQATVAYRPYYYSNVFNGNSAIMTNSTRYFSFDLSEINNTNYTLITVSKRQSSTGNVVGMLATNTAQGLTLGYAGSTAMRFWQYSNYLSITVPAYTATELPSIMACQFDENVGKKAWRIYDGSNTNRSGANKTHYALTGQGTIGRYTSSTAFNGYIAEVIVYNRILSTSELKQVHTYLSVKYGLSVPVADHLYPLDATFQNDVFGIGYSTAQALNQPTSESAGVDDIIQISNPSAMGENEYLICGNDNASAAFGAYSGASCTVSSIMARDWKFRHVGNLGTVDLRFDMTGITGFSSSDLRLLVDLDGDGYDDETPLEGTYSAPYFTVSGATVPNGAKATLCTVQSHYYAVASGLVSGAIWSNSPAGTPGFLNTSCAETELTILTGKIVENDWASLTCRKITVEAGATFNSGALASQNIYIHGDVVINGVWNDGNCNLNMPGTAEQNITGTGYLRVQNWAITNTSGVNISNLGAIIYGNISITAGGKLNTNGKLTLWSDASGTGEIQSLSGGTLSGLVNVRRYRPAGPIGWVNFSSSLQSAIVDNWDDDIITSGFTGSDYPAYNFNSIQYYNENLPGDRNQGYVGVTSHTDVLVPGRGYFEYMPAGAATLITRGTINSGSINLNPQYTANGSGAGWNLLGNPYPATISWDSPSWTKTNMNNAVYIYRASLNQYASYVNGVSTNGGDGLIAPGQSFFVEANASGAALILTEDCKSKAAGAFRSSQVAQQMLSLHLSNGNWQDETILIRNEYATHSYDREFDAKKLRSPMPEAPYMATVDANGEDLSINSMGSGGEEEIIPIRLEAGVTGVYMLQVSGIEAFAKGACITLEDIFTGTTYVLNNQEMIEIPLEAGDHTLRYQLRIGAAALSSVTDADCTSKNSGSAEVTLPMNTTSVVEWFNAAEASIGSTAPVNGIARKESLSPGSYSAHITNNGACGTTRFSFEVALADKLIASSIVLPSSCENTDDGGISVNISGGNAPYDVKWSNGSVGQTIESATPGKYTAAVTDSKGCQGTFEFEVQSVSTLLSKFEVSHEQVEMVNGEAVVEFTNTSSDADGFSWNFGDGSDISQEEHPAHAYLNAGVYEVMLKASSDNCESVSTRTMAITDNSHTEEFAGNILATLTDRGVQMSFLFDELKNIRISAYNVLGQQLIEPIVGQFGKQTITFSDRRYAANALIEVTDLSTGENTLIRMGR
jgi:PKD repeat protein